MNQALHKLRKCRKKGGWGGWQAYKLHSCRNKNLRLTPESCGWGGKPSENSTLVKVNEKVEFCFYENDVMFLSFISKTTILNQSLWCEFLNINIKKLY